MRDSIKVRVLTATVVILLIVIIILVARSCFPDDKIIIDPNATDITDPSNDGNLSDGGIKVVGFKGISVKANTTNISSYFINPESNEVYFVARLYLKDGTFLYQSGLIPPGKAVYNIIIAEPLAAGNHEAVVYYDTYGVDDMAKKNTAQINFVITATDD